MARCRRCGNSHNDVGATSCKLCGTALPPPGMHRTTARMSSNYRDTSSWKRRQLVRIGAAPIELTVGKRLVVGRSSECEVHVPSPKVSRQHASIEWRGEHPVLRDLGSQNGTTVNGKPIREHRLIDEDEIGIGPFTCTYRCLTGQGSLQAREQDLEDSQADTQTMLAVAMSGDLQEVSVYELLETFSYNQKTGTLEVFSPKDVEGKVTLVDGVATHAEVGKLLGDRAILHLLTWEHGRFRMIAGADTTLTANVRGTVQHLLTRFGQTLPKSGEGDYRASDGG